VIQRNFGIKYRNWKNESIEVFIINENWFERQRQQVQLFRKFRFRAFFWQCSSFEIHIEIFLWVFSISFFLSLVRIDRLKGELAMRSFEKCLCFTLASINYYEDLLHKFSILLVYFPLATGGRKFSKQNCLFLTKKNNNNNRSNKCCQSRFRRLDNQCWWSVLRTSGSWRKRNKSIHWTVKVHFQLRWKHFLWFPFFVVKFKVFNCFVMKSNKSMFINYEHMLHLIQKNSVRIDIIRFSFLFLLRIFFSRKYA